MQLNYFSIRTLNFLASSSGEYNLRKSVLRVQVKSAHRVSLTKGGGYQIQAHAGGRSYRAREIDLLAAYVVPEDVWYVFPPIAFRKMKALRLYPPPGGKNSKFDKYREAGYLFQL
jgi:hypothetical protein